MQNKIKSFSKHQCRNQNCKAFPHFIIIAKAILINYVDLALDFHHVALQHSILDRSSIAMSKKLFINSNFSLITLLLYNLFRNLTFHYYQKLIFGYFKATFYVKVFQVFYYY